MNTIGSIKDASIYILPSKNLMEYIETLKYVETIPLTIKTIIKNHEKDSLSTDLKLSLTDIRWLQQYLEKSENENHTIYLHEFLNESKIILPQNEVLERNPELEERCVKLRKNQMNREYRAMTKNVDNVRSKQPEETIAYHIKHLNKQLIAVAQFIMSVAAGFLFGFLGIELILGRLDFGFRLLLGVMCALIIALAEIYFLAKKLNEDLTITETIQLGGPSVYPKKHD